METIASVRAEQYYSLAETLAGTPDWLAGAGTTWPLFKVALRLARETGSIAAGQAVTALAAVRPETMAARQRRYRQVFVDTNRRGRSVPIAANPPSAGPNCRPSQRNWENGRPGLTLAPIAGRWLYRLIIKFLKE